MSDRLCIFWHRGGSVSSRGHHRCTSPVSQGEDVFFFLWGGGGGGGNEMQNQTLTKYCLVNLISCAYASSFLLGYHSVVFIL